MHFEYVSLVFYTACLFNSVLLTSIKENDINTVINHLHKFEYFTDIVGPITLNELKNLIKRDNSSLIAAVQAFQINKNLKYTDGEITQETIRYIKRPRCGISSETEQQYSKTHYKWSNLTLTWYFNNGTYREKFVTKRAFSLWSKHSNIIFNMEQQSTNANIVISKFSKKHNYSETPNMQCSSFDGEGGALAHASFPSPHKQQLEIHLDDEERWDQSLITPANDSVTINLYLVLLHEIGHTLGIAHSDVSESIMNPYYSTPQNISSLLHFDLYEDDIKAIQNLYGKPPSKGYYPLSPPTTISSTAWDPYPTTADGTTPTTSTTAKPVYTTALPSHTTGSVIPGGTVPDKPDLCSTKNLYTYLILSGKLFVFQGAWVWMIPLTSGAIDTYHKEPELITQWLPFLPMNFTKINAIYQKPNTNIVLLSNNILYVIIFPSLK